jgi:anti-sigma factor RsiW
MTNEELTELIGVSIDEDLPDTLRAAVERALADDPVLARDTAALRGTVLALKALPSEKPDTWFVERALQGLFREHDNARHDNILRMA